jgi:flagellin
MLSLHTNAASLSAQNAISRNQSALSTSMTRLSTGYRINSAMDDAAGLQIATRLKTQTSGMAVAMRNTQNATSMLQTAEGSLDEVTNMLTRMKDLATQAADGSSTAADQTAMQTEFDALGRELNNVMNKTSYGGQQLFVGAASTLGAGPVTFQTGAAATETMSVDLSATFGSGGATIDAALQAAIGTYAAPAPATVGSELTAAGGATAAITALSNAIDQVAGGRSEIGAAANRLDHVYNNLANISTNTKNATGRLMDVDFASESSNMTSNQMLLQAGTAMLKQTNSISGMVMSLLQ